MFPPKASLAYPSPSSFPCTKKRAKVAVPSKFLLFCENALESFSFVSIYLKKQGETIKSLWNQLSGKINSYLSPWVGMRALFLYLAWWSIDFSFTLVWRSEESWSAWLQNEFSATKGLWFLARRPLLNSAQYCQIDALSQEVLNWKLQHGFILLLTIETPL